MSAIAASSAAAGTCCLGYARHMRRSPWRTTSGGRPRTPPRWSLASPCPHCRRPPARPQFASKSEEKGRARARSLPCSQDALRFRCGARTHSVTGAARDGAKSSEVVAREIFLLQSSASGSERGIQGPARDLSLASWTPGSFAPDRSRVERRPSCYRSRRAHHHGALRRLEPVQSRARGHRAQRVMTSSPMARDVSPAAAARAGTCSRAGAPPLRVGASGCSSMEMLRVT